MVTVHTSIIEVVVITSHHLLGMQLKSTLKGS